MSANSGVKWIDQTCDLAAILTISNVIKFN